LGARSSRNVAVKTLVAGGVPLALGSDGPMNPYLNMMFAAINEANPAEDLSIEQSLAAYTRGSAAAEMMEKEKGTLAENQQPPHDRWRHGRTRGEVRGDACAAPCSGAPMS
jgi:predicted amidohydrolase YtcJ